MKKITPLIIVIAMFSWAVYEFIGSSTEQEELTETDEVGLNKNQIAPNFQLTTLDGQEVSLTDYRGQRVMLNFWATWCPPCRAEMPDMEEFYQAEDVKVLAINMTASEKNEDVVFEFRDELELTFPILMDKDGSVVKSYQVQAYPTTYMIDSEGRIQFITQGAMNRDQMLQQLTKMN